MGDIFDVAAAQNQQQQQQTQPSQQSQQQGDVFDQATRQATPAPAPSTAAPTGVSGFLNGVYDSTVGPVLNLAGDEYRHLTAPSSQAQTEPDPFYQALQGILDSHKQVAHKAMQALKEHRYSEAAGYAGATMLPVLGPAAAKSAEDIGRGDIAYGLGEGTGLIGSVLAPRAVGKAVKAARDIPGTAAGATQVVRDAFSTKAIQPGLQSGLRAIAADVADEAGVTASKAKSIRDVYQNAGDAILAKSKSQYAALDKSSGGQFQRFDNALRNINQRLREVVGVEDEATETALLERKAQIEAAQDAAFEEARAQGVDPKMIDEARGNYRQAQALYDLDYQVKKAAGGMRPDIGDAKQAAKNPEFVDPRRLFNRTTNLYDSGRLQDALGESGANDLLEHANNNLVQHSKVLRNQKIATTAGKAALGTGLLYEAGRGVMGK